MTAVVTAVAVGASLLAGPYRKGALVGAGTVSSTAFASLLLMGRGARARKPMNAALAVMVLMFLVRIVLVALGTALTVRAGESVVAFIVAFFVPYFIFAAIEGWYLHSLRGTGTTA
jgi:Kef-type K+ transport system membrane component KefB